MAELVREYARSGAPTARIDNRYLHSRYDPARDAARFVSTSLDTSSRPGTVIVVGATLGHLGTALGALHPEVRRLALCLWDELAADTAPAFHHTWSPNSGPLATFLRTLIDEVDIGSLAVLEWRPAMEADPALALSVLADLRRTLDERRSSRDTVSAFGARWLRNTSRNLAADLGEPVDLGSATQSGRTARGPALVALAGPSLEVAVERAGNRLHGIPIVAVASSALALAARNLRPLVVVATDAGSWAGLLLAHVVARLGPQTLIAAPPSARLPLPAGFRFAPIGQPSVTEAELLAAVGLTSPIIPPQGTVAATAMTLALELGFDPVYVAGLDLAHTGGQSHARPHPLASYHRITDQRVRPYAHALFARQIEASHAHASYRSFFSDVDDRRVRQVVTNGNDRTMPRLAAVSPEEI